MWQASDAVEIDRPAVVIGSTADNRVLSYVLWGRQWMTCGAPGGVPGTDRAYVSHPWRQFSRVHDSVPHCG